MIAYVSQFTGKQRTITPCDFSLEPYSFGGLWPAGRFNFAYAFLGIDNAYAGLSPLTPITLPIAGANLAVRIPGNAGSKAIGFVPFFQWLDAPDPTWQKVFFPCCPANGNGKPFHFSTGDLRWNGQLLNIYPWNPATGSAPAHWLYVDPVTNKPAFPKGGTGWDGQSLNLPSSAPTVTIHGCLPPAQYAVQLAEVLPDLRESISNPQTVTLDPSHRAILIHRHGQVQQGVTSRKVYLNGKPVVCPIAGSTYWPRNWITWWI
jgi:hypothetical protein